MDKITLSTFSLEQQSFNYRILGDLEVSVNIQENPYNIPLQALFGMAARVNKKRGFLFVSKVLGKHIPVPPAASLLSGAALAARFVETFYKIPVDRTSLLVQGIVQPETSVEAYTSMSENLMTLPEPVIVIGFAETATALGHSVFASFKNNAAYIHTTREWIDEISPDVTFDEEHSHAVAHRFYPLHLEALSTAAPIVLVDDEITTGNTALNIIREIHSKYPRKDYVVASLLDWRSKEHGARFKELEEQLQITITTVSLLKGEISQKGNPICASVEEEPVTAGSGSEIEVIPIDSSKLTALRYSSTDSAGKVLNTPFLLETGRFGISTDGQRQLEAFSQNIGSLLQQYRTGKTLCIGTGEFMYIPMLVSAHMGKDVSYHSTTRSPIHAVDRKDYAVKNKKTFTSPEDTNVVNYIYNIPDHFYDDIFVFMERETGLERLDSFYQVLHQLKISKKYVVFFSRAEQEGV